MLINATLNETAKNGTLSGRAAATPHGLLLAYISLVIMAVIPIWFGSFKSVIFNKKQKVSYVMWITALSPQLLYLKIKILTIKIILVDDFLIAVYNMYMQSVPYISIYYLYYNF